MYFLRDHLRCLVLALTGLCVSCETHTAQPICADPDTPELTALCELDAALSVPQTVQGRLDACAAIEPLIWREGCLVQVAEQQAWDGDLPGAFDSCLEAATLTAQCLEQVGWAGVQGRVKSGPAAEDVSDQIDALVATLPKPNITTALRGYQAASRIARASTWHGIYAGSGSTDPTALNSARGNDEPYARAAFAWEAVRLLPSELSVDDTIAAVQAIAAGERAPVTGPPLAQACWQDTPMPRLAEDFRLKPATRAYGSWLRFTDIDPEIDLLIAIYDAIVLHRKTLPAESILALKAHPSQEVQKSAARYVALLAPPGCGKPDSDGHAAQCTEMGWDTPDPSSGWRDERRYVLSMIRTSVREDLVPRHFPTVPCP